MRPVFGKRSSLFLALLFTAVLSAMLFVSPAWPQTNLDMVTIAGNNPPALQQATLAGHANSNDVITIVVGPQMRNEANLDALIERLHDKFSPEYHRWMTPADFLRDYAPAQTDVDKVVDHLKSNGLTV